MEWVRIIQRNRSSSHNDEIFMDLSNLINQGDGLGSLPGIYFQLEEAINSDSASFDDIGRIISSDPVLTARLLRIVNSAFYGFSSKIETVSHALTLCGTQQLSELVLASSVMEKFIGLPEQLIDMKSFWLHSVACGLVARSLADFGGEYYNVERFFVSGLLHDIGRLVMCLRASDIMKEVFLSARENGTSLHDEEHRIFEFDHAEAGGELLKTWNLPDRLIEIVTFHHKPEASRTYSKETAIVSLSDKIVYFLSLGGSGEEVPPIMTAESWEAIGLSHEIYLPMIKETIPSQLEGVARVFL